MNTNPLRVNKMKNGDNGEGSKGFKQIPKSSHGRDLPKEGAKRQKSSHQSSHPSSTTAHRGRRLCGVGCVKYLPLTNR